jgi:hypothetical protein
MAILAEDVQETRKNPADKELNEADWTRPSTSFGKTPTNSSPRWWSRCGYLLILPRLRSDLRFADVLRRLALPA